MSQTPPRSPAFTPLLLVSLDATDSRDAKFLSSLPHFAALRARGTAVLDVDSVFVTNTYVVHTSAVTGVEPRLHGIVENQYAQPGRRYPSWRCDAREIRVPTLWQKAAEAGIPVLSAFYPVTGGADIRWNIVEAPGHMSLARRGLVMLRKGSAGFTLREGLRGLRGFSPRVEPWLDDLTTRICARGIRRLRPGLTLLHLIDVDFQKHRFGPRSEQARQALRRQDERLGALDAAMREAFGGRYAVLVFSDHGCLPVQKRADPNDFLARRGFIRSPGRSPGDFDAFVHNAGGSAFLKLLREERRAELLAAVPALLREPFAGRRLTDDEMERSGMKGEFVLGFEARGGYTLGGGLHKGEHGYTLRHEGYQPFYLAAGPGVPAGGLLRGGSLLDVCPLAADLLGIPQWPMQGADRVLPRP